MRKTLAPLAAALGAAFFMGTALAAITPNLPPFTPTPSFSSLSVSSASARVSLPSGQTVVIYNQGTVDAYVSLGSNTVTATTAGADIVRAGGCAAFTPSAGSSYLAAITVSGSTALMLSGGSGFPVGCDSSSGGSAGGGSGGTVTQGSGNSATPWYVAQSGNWAITNTAFGISGTLPAFAATPTFNLGTLNGAATDATLQGIRTALGTPFQAGGAISNTGFAITGLLPGFAATPTVNLGTLGGGALAANQTSVQSAPGTPAGTAVTVQGSPSGAALPVSQSGPWTFSATIGGFAPTPAYASLSVGPTSANVALPSGSTVVVYNTGAYPAYVRLGNNTVVATSTNDMVPAGGWMAFTVGSNTNLAAISPAGSTALSLSGGAGLPTGSGGGGGSSGGAVAQGNAGSAGQAWYVRPTDGTNVPAVKGASTAPVATDPASVVSLSPNGNGVKAASGAVFPTSAAAGAYVDGSLVSLGSTGDAAWGGTGPASALAVLKALHGDLTAPTPAGSNTIGSVNQAGAPWAFNLTEIAGTTVAAPSTWGSAPTGFVPGVNANVVASLPAGSNTIGTVNLGTIGAAATAANQTAVAGSATGGAAAASSQLAGAVYNASQPTLTTGQQAALQADNNGNLKTVSQGGTIAVTSSALPTGAATAANQTAVQSAPGTSATTAVTVQGSASGAALPTAGATNVTPNDCSVTVTTGGTAQNAIAAQTTLHGFTIVNIDSTTGGGETIWFSFTGTAAAGAAGSYPLTASSSAMPGSYTSPVGFGTNHAVSVVAPTAGHKISCTWW